MITVGNKPRHLLAAHANSLRIPRVALTWTVGGNSLEFTVDTATLSRWSVNGRQRRPLSLIASRPCQTVPHIYIFSCKNHTIQIQDLFYQRSLRVVFNYLINRDTDPPDLLAKFLGGVRTPSQSPLWMRLWGGVPMESRGRVPIVRGQGKPPVKLVTLL